MRVAVCQLNSRTDLTGNLSAARTLLEQAAAAGADFAVLPEYTDYLGPQPAPGHRIDGAVPAFFSTAARELGIWVHLGSFHEAGPERGIAYNTSAVFNRQGDCVAQYRKIHLYDVEIPGRVRYRESESVAPGDRVAVAEVDRATVGLSICYDLRFPELYRRLVAQGANVLVVPAAFMLHTGRDHWEVLLRARAVENQCYVLAAAQIGEHDPERTCFGRSMVIDPWGIVLAQAADRVGIAVAELDFEELARIRTEMPSLDHRRL